MTVNSLVDSIPALTGIILGIITMGFRAYVRGVLNQHFSRRGPTFVDRLTDDSLYVVELVSANLAPIVAYSSILQVGIRQGLGVPLVIGYFVLIIVVFAVTIQVPFRISPQDYFERRRFLPFRLLGSGISLVALAVTIALSAQVG